MPSPDSGPPAPVDLTEHTLTSEPVFSGVLLQVRRDTVRTPVGGESVREWVSHPGAAAVVPLFADGTTVLVRQYRYPSRREFLEVPAGKLVEGEADYAVYRKGKPWDHVPGSLLVTEAGGYVGTFSGEPYDPQGPEPSGLVSAADRATYDLVQGLLPGLG